MNREYIGYVGEACKDGMSPEEVQQLFSNILDKSNTRKGKRVLKLFAKGVGKAKKDVLKKSAVNNLEKPLENEKEKQYQYVKAA